MKPPHYRVGTNSSQCQVLVAQTAMQQLSRSVFACPLFCHTHSPFECTSVDGRVWHGRGKLHHSAAASHTGLLLLLKDPGFGLLGSRVTTQPTLLNPKSVGGLVQAHARNTPLQTPQSAGASASVAGQPWGCGMAFLVLLTAAQLLHNLYTLKGSRIAPQLLLSCCHSTQQHTAAAQRSNSQDAQGLQ